MVFVDAADGGAALGEGFPGGQILEEFLGDHVDLALAAVVDVLEVERSAIVKNVSQVVPVGRVFFHYFRRDVDLVVAELHDYAGRFQIRVHPFYRVAFLQEEGMLLDVLVVDHLGQDGVEAHDALDAADGDFSALEAHLFADVFAALDPLLNVLVIDLEGALEIEIRGNVDRVDALLVVFPGSPEELEERPDPAPDLPGFAVAVPQDRCVGIVRQAVLGDEPAVFPEAVDVDHVHGDESPWVGAAVVDRVGLADLHDLLAVNVSEILVAEIVFAPVLRGGDKGRHEAERRYGDGAPADLFRLEDGQDDEDAYQLEDHAVKDTDRDRRGAQLVQGGRNEEVVESPGMRALNGHGADEEKAVGSEGAAHRESQVAPLLSGLFRHRQKDRRDGDHAGADQHCQRGVRHDEEDAVDVLAGHVQLRVHQVAHADAAEEEGHQNEDEPVPQFLLLRHHDQGDDGEEGEDKRHGILVPGIHQVEPALQKERLNAPGEGELLILPAADGVPQALRGAGAAPVELRVRGRSDGQPEIHAKSQEEGEQKPPPFLVIEEFPVDPVGDDKVSHEGQYEHQEKVAFLQNVVEMEGRQPDQRPVVAHVIEDPQREEKQKDGVQAERHILLYAPFGAPGRPSHAANHHEDRVVVGVGETEDEGHGVKNSPLFRIEHQDEGEEHQKHHEEGVQGIDFGYRALRPGPRRQGEQDARGDAAQRVHQDRDGQTVFFQGGNDVQLMQIVRFVVEEELAGFRYDKRDQSRRQGAREGGPKVHPVGDVVPNGQKREDLGHDGPEGISRRMRDAKAVRGRDEFAGVFQADRRLKGIDIHR